MNDDLWNNIFGNFESMEERFEKMFSELSNGTSKTYGYTMYQGPDGVPHVKEFGNAINEFSPRLASSNTREPLTDVSRDGDSVFVTVELPGVSKEDIVLESNGNSLSVSVDTDSKSYAKNIALPCDVIIDSAKAEYNNGILQITMAAADANSNRGRRISIE